MFDCYIFAAESSSSSAESLVTKVAVAGSLVRFDCLLDKTCGNESFQWSHLSAFDTRVIIWYRKQKLSPTLESSGVKVEEDSANGKSVLTIPRARLKDDGRFHCQTTGVRCQMNFQLIVTGNSCKYSLAIGSLILYRLLGLSNMPASVI